MTGAAEPLRSIPSRCLSLQRGRDRITYHCLACLRALSHRRLAAETDRNLARKPLFPLRSVLYACSVSSARVLYVQTQPPETSAQTQASTGDRVDSLLSREMRREGLRVQFSSLNHTVRPFSAESACGSTNTRRPCESQLH